MKLFIVLYKLERKVTHVCTLFKIKRKLIVLEFSRPQSGSTMPLFVNRHYMTNDKYKSDVKVVLMHIKS